MMANSRARVVMILALLETRQMSKQTFTDETLIASQIQDEHDDLDRLPVLGDQQRFKRHVLGAKGLQP